MVDEQAYASIVFWRRSRWNGARCEPLLMTLHGDRLRACDRDGGEVLTAAAGQVAARLSRLGTLTLTVGGHAYALVGRGGAQSPAPSSLQQEGCAAFLADHPASAAPRRAGLLDQVLNGSAAAHMHTWADALAAAGAAVAR
ncbi:hypothetical protein [Streptomyces sp. NPDC001380]|uniref:hypothetical protein n=1 Tax=Streptomyces sp. NPDC001380 TaxID=3364566 RepID=UPI003698553D